jgi:hypothetical protein
MIKPTIGRKVWFTPYSGMDARSDNSHPLDATVTYVWHDRLVNLAVRSQSGDTIPGQTSVRLLQDDDEAPEGGYYAEWMPYQKSVVK